MTWAAKRERSIPSRAKGALVAYALTVSWIGVPATASDLGQPMVGLIIDDMGNHLQQGLTALELPGSLTYSFLPHTPHAARLARRAHSLDKEVMLHLPMDSMAGKPLGPGALTAGMSRNQLRATLKTSLDAIPHVRGVNNHMGSLLTRRSEPMQWLMAGIRAYGDLYFVDSRTTHDTVAARVAVAHRVPAGRRHVFLDNTRDADAIRAQFRRLVTLARAKGAVIAIAHPYPETIAVLTEALPGLAAAGLRQVKLSQLIQTQSQGVPLWQVSSSPSPKVARNSKRSPSSTCCAEPVSTW